MHFTCALLVKTVILFSQVVFVLGLIIISTENVVDVTLGSSVGNISGNMSLLEGEHI